MTFARSGRLGVSLAIALLLIGTGAVLAETGTAETGSDVNTASFSVTASGTLSIAQINEPNLPPLAMVPAGFQIIGSASGAPTTVEQSGSGALAFGGSFTTGGTGLTTVVTLASDVAGTAVPAGVADGFETATGSIQFINNADFAIEVHVAFDSLVTVAGSVTDPTLESVTDVFYDVEFSETLGGDPGSPCTGGILVDVQDAGLGAPPDLAIGPLGAPSIRSIIIPDGSTCSFNVLVQAGGRAAAQAPTPTPTPTPTPSPTPTPAPTPTPTPSPTPSPTPTVFVDLQNPTATPVAPAKKAPPKRPAPAFTG